MSPTTPLNQPAAGLGEGAVDVAFVRPPFVDEGISMVTVLTEPRYAVLRDDHPLAAREYVRRGRRRTSRGSGSRAPIRAPARSGRWRSSAATSPLRTGTRITSIEEAFGAVAAGVAITCQAESAVRAIRPAARSCDSCRSRGAPLGAGRGRMADGGETELARAFVRTAIEISASAAAIDNGRPGSDPPDRCFPNGAPRPAQSLP